MSQLNHALQSEQIGDLISALSKAQSEIDSASFDKVNPHFKSRYASYESIREVCRVPLSKNALAITHHLDMAEGKRILVTQLSHASGQWMRSFVTMPQEKETPQSMGSAITYSKRYALSAFLAIGSDEDDDGEEAERSYRDTPKLSAAQAREIEEQCDDPEFLNRILRAYKVTNLLAISANEFQSILKRINVTKGRDHAKVGT
jgi:hypothetical protein